MKTLNSKMIVGKVTQLDKGLFNTSVIIKSGKRLISVIMQNSEVIKSDIEKDRKVYCLINNNKITVFRDTAYYFNKFHNKDLKFEIVPSSTYNFG